MVPLVFQGLMIVIFNESDCLSQCTELCFQSLDENKTNTIDDSLKTLHQNVLVPKIVSAFMWESEEYITLPKQSRVELDMFKAVSN
ncbi:hypothetical protein AVEN_267053-1 [Araneus ventricosus]|uniref:Uncharacterized protein n=1 Tax=Araneus ventricosus TaxID=182803 RepID=A0A4Y2DTX5_ARAVE|nr:hypothetical protein AVEN_267053-1 [Araneus ventricosus]